MKIQKLKNAGLAIYPATIASAVKDLNFLKEDNSPMTQAEINLYLNNKSGSSASVSTLSLDSDGSLHCTNSEGGERFTVTGDGSLTLI